MATVVVEATEPEPSGSIANPAASTSPSLSHRFLDSKFYLLVVVGETVTEEHLRRAIGNIELGKQSRGPPGTCVGRCARTTPPRARRPPCSPARPAPTPLQATSHTPSGPVF